MSFPRYPAYKDSGVDRLGQVPEHWDVRRLKFLCDIQTGSKDTENAVENGEYPFFVRSQTVERIDSWTFDCEAVLTAGDGAGVGKVFHHYEGPFDFHQRVYMLNNFRGTTGRFVFHFLKENFYKVALEGGAKSTVDSLRRPMFTNFPVAVPPREEQHSLICFVDTQGAHIDALVAEQERLIDFLREKRQAVISRAVTKGLDPTVPMKDSGVEWLGDVPAHWEIFPMKRSISAVDQGDSPQCLSEPASSEEWGVLKVSCVNGGRFSAEEQKALPLDTAFDPRAEVRSGDIVVSRGNTLELVGSAAFVGAVRSRLLLSDLLYRFRAAENNSGRFLAYWLNSSFGRYQIERDAVGTSASMKKLSKEVLASLTIVVPPPHEQHAIAAYLDRETARIDALITEAERAIALLQERRAALISAAVTGQIDVRGLTQENIA